MHVNRNTVVLRSRPWHYAWRPNVNDHWVARYTHGLYTIVPGGTAMMPKFEDDDTTASGNARKGKPGLPDLGFLDAFPVREAFGGL
jgi:hypothetical protein